MIFSKFYKQLLFLYYFFTILIIMTSHADNSKTLEKITDGNARKKRYCSFDLMDFFFLLELICMVCRLTMEDPHALLCGKKPKYIFSPITFFDLTNMSRSYFLWTLYFAMARKQEGVSSLSCICHTTTNPYQRFTKIR
jgi:hypothetical protein